MTERDVEKMLRDDATVRDALDRDHALERRAELVRIATEPTSPVVPRRCRIDLATPEELAIRAAMAAVEKLGAHPRLTDAVVALGQGLAALSDWVDAVEVEKLRAEIERLRGVSRG